LSAPVTNTSPLVGLTAIACAWSKSWSAPSHRALHARPPPLASTEGTASAAIMAVRATSVRAREARLGPPRNGLPGWAETDMLDAPVGQRDRTGPADGECRTPTRIPRIGSGKPLDECGGPRYLA